MIEISVRGVLFLTLMFSQAVLAEVKIPSALVSGDWLIKQSSQKGLAVLDVQEAALFARHHVPGAINWPFSQWRSDADGKPPKSLLPLEKMTKRLGQLGIDAATPVVIVATGTGAGDLAASARVFWTLKVLGHENIAILDGGLVSYVNRYAGSYESGKADKRLPTVYRAKPNLSLLATADWLKGAKVPRLDARSLEEHVGLIGGEGERLGTLHGALHLPFDWLVEPNGSLKSAKKLQALFGYAGLDKQGTVHFCHTGNRASLTWFVDYAVLGNQSARLYDGSMLEWGKTTDLLIEQKVKP